MAEIKKISYYQYRVHNHIQKTGTLPNFRLSWTKMKNRCFWFRTVRVWYYVGTKAARITNVFLPKIPMLFVNFPLPYLKVQYCIQNHRPLFLKEGYFDHCFKLIPKPLFGGIHRKRETVQKATSIGRIGGNISKWNCQYFKTATPSCIDVCFWNIEVGTSRLFCEVK